MTTWYAPAPGTPAHRIRTGVRAVVWGMPAVVLLVPVSYTHLTLPTTPYV